jgi:vacuolar-type H+-ATPase subunit E/Vma4
MALDVLLQAIADDGASEARQIVDAARGEATALRAAADARVERRITEACAAREEELRAGLDTRRARATTEARARVLAARARFMDRIFLEAESALPGCLERSAAPETLATLCREALEFFPPGGARIRCRGALARMITVSLPGASVVVDDEVPEGVIVESIDGSCRIDNTLVGRLRRRRPELSIAITAGMGSSP